MKLLNLFLKFFRVTKQEGIVASCSKAIRYLKKVISKPTQILLDFDHQPLISVLVVSYNSREELIKLFTSLQHQSYRNFEVILVENGDQDNSILLHDAFKDCKYINSDNIGFAGANNLAFEHSRGSYVFLANPDIVLADDVLMNLIDQFRKVTCFVTT